MFARFGYVFVFSSRKTKVNTQRCSEFCFFNAEKYVFRLNEIKKVGSWWQRTKQFLFIRKNYFVFRREKTQD